MATDITTIFVNIPLRKAIEVITTAIGSVVSVTHLQGAEGRECAVAVYEKYYMRMQASSVATVIFEDVGGKIKVSCVCAGSARFFTFGANTHFQKEILSLLKAVEIAGRA